MKRFGATTVVLCLVFVGLSGIFPGAKADDGVFTWQTAEDWDTGTKTVENGTRVAESYNDNHAIIPGGLGLDPRSNPERNLLRLRNSLGDQYPVDDADGATWKWVRPAVAANCANDADIYTGSNTAGDRGLVFWQNATHGTNPMTRTSRNPAYPFLQLFEWDVAVDFGPASANFVWSMLLISNPPDGLVPNNWWCNQAKVGNPSYILMQLAPVGNGYLGLGMAIHVGSFDSTCGGVAQFFGNPPPLLLSIWRDGSGNVNGSWNTNKFPDCPMTPAARAGLQVNLWREYDLKATTATRVTVQSDVTFTVPGRYNVDTWERGSGTWTSPVVSFGTKVPLSVTVTYSYPRDRRGGFDPVDYASFEKIELLNSAGSVLKLIAPDVVAFGNKITAATLFDGPLAFPAGAVPPDAAGYKLRLTLHGDVNCGCSMVAIHSATLSFAATKGGGGTVPGNVALFGLNLGGFLWFGILIMTIFTATFLTVGLVRRIHDGG